MWTRSWSCPPCQQAQPISNLSPLCPVLPSGYPTPEGANPPSGPNPFPTSRRSALLFAAPSPPPNPMGDPHPLSSAHLTAAASSAREHRGPTNERLAASDPSTSFAKRPRVAAEPSDSGGCVPCVEADVRALVSVSGGIYPLARAGALRGLTAVLEKVDTSSCVSAAITDCCYKCAVELMRDDDNGVRLAVVRLVRFCRFVNIFCCVWMPL
jgi:hypothetical protein